ncbi:conserved hypothetical protein [delta proteobacterium NaphS2]|nr:conserved hypothetical protein [delta proteobacterium NaphS2]
MVYYWIEHQIVPIRRLNATSPYWITLSPSKEKELSEWVKNSSKISKQRSHHSQTITVGGAV